MALTKNTTTVTNIADLSSTPNATEGLTAAQLQAKFDKTGADLKTYINDTLTAELDTYHGNVSATELSYSKGVTSAIQTQLTNLKDRGYGIYNSFITTPFTTTSGSYVNVTDGGTDNVNFSITTKGGKILLEVAAPISVNTQVGSLGVRINGVDYDIVSSNATTSMFSVGKVVVSGLAAGTYTVQLRGKVQTATTVTLTVGSYKTISMFALEIQ